MIETINELKCPTCNLVLLRRGYCQYLCYGCSTSFYLSKPYHSQKLEILENNHDKNNQRNRN